MALESYMTIISQTHCLAKEVSWALQGEGGDTDYGELGTDSSLCPMCSAQEHLGAGVSGVEAQLCSVHQAVCPEEGTPDPSVSPQEMAFLIQTKASHTGEVALV